MHMYWNIIAFQRNVFLKFLKLKSYAWLLPISYWSTEVSSSYPRWRSTCTPSTGPEGGLRNTQTMREWHTAGIDRRLTVLVRVFNQDSQFLHTELWSGEKGKTEGETKGITTMLNTFPNHLTSTPKRKPTSDGTSACLKSTYTLQWLNADI